jgi:antirestriction protein ArdC
MKDIHAAITERFIDQLRAGTVPWQRPWRGAQNIVSRKPYRGINSLMLGLSTFGSPFWMTFRQALELGGHVRKGEESTPVIYYKFLEKRDAARQLVMTAKGKPAFRPFIRWSNVFNLDQTEGVKAPDLPVPQELDPSPTRAEALSQTADLCPIRQEGFAAAYSPTEDLIRMPRHRAFRSSEEYFHTLFHEMIHATGHSTRLDREGITNPIKFGSERYSKEESIAELGAAFLSNEAGILAKRQLSILQSCPGRNYRLLHGTLCSSMEHHRTSVFSSDNHLTRAYLMEDARLRASSSAALKWAMASV